MAIQANDIFIYPTRENVVFDYSPLGCAQNGELDIENEFFDISTKGTGKVASLKQKGYKGSLSCSGVIDFSRLTGINLLPAALEGQTVQLYVFGTDENSNEISLYFLAKINNIRFGWATNGLMKFSAVFVLVSEVVYESANIYVSTYPIKAARSYLRTSTTTEEKFTDTSSLAGLDATRLVISKNNRVLPVEAIANDSLPVSSGAVGYVPSGTLKFNPSLIAGDKIIVFY
ncbi:hypothetical protein UFOVP402_21 [uncultured Caudovirales phage]|uniref:Uncharacterized protein n=1 Tax=uncultured Caudovirales phage TaxID=2100421 RepID=A0A6J5M256_9CAUD|nr:hypothetical protein UFOVP402_21 [uncultured Caudovirales phage]